MSDAIKQSVERCKYQHEWESVKANELKRGLPEDVLGYRCKLCKFEPIYQSKTWHEAEAILHLRSVLHPGDTVYCVLRHVSRSGMSRNIDFYYIADGAPVWIASYVGHALGTPQSLKNWERSQGLTVGGCGMDMGFHMVYNLSRVLFPHGFACTGDKCGSNDHSNDRDGSFDRNKFAGKMHTGDGGYALRHSWL